MPSKFKKALGTVKDQTSIGLAIVSKTATGSINAHLDLLVLKATTHDENPIDDRLVSDLLLLTSSSFSTATASVTAISHRIDRTRNWVVALKCLHLVYLCLRDGGPHFPREAITAMSRGDRLLDLSDFRDESVGTNPWDYTAFVRTFALYLHEHLTCGLRGKLQNRRPLTGSNPISDMKPPEILDRIAYWQRLLDRAIATRPTGPARNNILVHVSFQLVVRESFDLYKDVSDGIVLLLDSFFQLQRQTCVWAYQTCLRAKKQFDELAVFYDACRIMAIGRRSEYPEVQKISGKLLKTLNDFIKSNEDTGKNKQGQAQLLLPPKPKEREDGSPRRERRKLIRPTTGSRRSYTLSDLVLFGDDSDDEMKSKQRRSHASSVVSDMVMLEAMPKGEEAKDSDSDKLREAKGNNNVAVTDLNLMDEDIHVDEKPQPVESKVVVPDLVVFDDDDDPSVASSSGDLVVFDGKFSTSFAQRNDDWELMLAESANGISACRNISFTRAFEGVITGGFGSQEVTNPFLEMEDDTHGSNGNLVVWNAPLLLPPDGALVPLPEKDPFSLEFTVPVNDPARQQQVLLQQ